MLLEIVSCMIGAAMAVIVFDLRHPGLLEEKVIKWKMNLLK